MEKMSKFKTFLETYEVLIVDKNPSSRSRLVKTIYDLGAKRTMIHTPSSISEAEEIIESKNIGIVLSEYFIGGGSGFDLFKLIRQKSSEKDKLCLFLVTSNISQTAVAKAAEEDVDSFIIKPYTVHGIQENLVATVMAKISPSEYKLRIEEGKKLIQKGEFENAIGVFKTALKLHQRPALALFYIGQAEYLRDSFDEANDSYSKGLNLNSIHLKCLVGLYDLLMERKKYTDAYEVVKKIAKYFPANPDRLIHIIRLTVQTKNFHDMQMYYEIFTSLEERTPISINHIGAGLYVSGKHFLKEKDLAKATQAFDSLAVSCSDYTKFLRATIVALIEFNHASEAIKYLKRFPVDTQESEDFIVSDFLITAKTTNDYNFLVKAGLELYNKKIRDHACLEVLVFSMEKSGYKEDKILPYRQQIGTTAQT